MEEDYTIPTETTTATQVNIGTTPLPATQDMPKWLVVMVVIGIVAVFGYLTVSQEGRIKDQKEQNKILQENYNALLTQFVFRGAEVEQLKAEKQQKNELIATDSVVREQTLPYVKKILKNK